jgi:hypothetical protein
MQKYLIAQNNTIIESLNDDVYENQTINKVKEKLNEYKSKLDIIYDAPNGKYRFDMIRNGLDDYYLHKKELYSAGINYASNAFIKMYEMLHEFAIIPHILNILAKEKKANGQLPKFYSFHNAEFPGSFIMATKKYMEINYPHIAWKWYASSFLDGPLNDEYSLYKTNRSQWIMSDENDATRGDVTNDKFQYYLQNLLSKKKIMLYTSDLGFEVSDYNNQETLQAHANFGQIISGLLVLAEGGVFITKGYTIFEPFTVSLTALLSSMFDEFYITKPHSSRTLNSETYFYGKGYNPIDDSMRNLLLDRLQNFSMTPLLAKEDLGDSYMSIKNAVAQLSLTQAIKIEQFITFNKQFNAYHGKQLTKKINESIGERKMPHFLKEILAEKK